MKKIAKLQKWYTRVIGIFYVLLVTTLILDLMNKGVNLETWHKVLHIGIGVYAVWLGFYARNADYKTFCLGNGALFGLFALTGWFYPDFLGIDAFNRLDTILHTIVSGTGLSIGLMKN